MHKTIWVCLVMAMEVDLLSVHIRYQSLGVVYISLRVLQIHMHTLPARGEA